jgi:hypothetical protein
MPNAECRRPKGKGGRPKAEGEGKGKGEAVVGCVGAPHRDGPRRHAHRPPYVLG